MSQKADQIRHKEMLELSKMAVRDAKPDSSTFTNARQRFKDTISLEVHRLYRCFGIPMPAKKQFEELFFSLAWKAIFTTIHEQKGIDMDRKEQISDPNYWLTSFQLDLLTLVNEVMDKIKHTPEAKELADLHAPFIDRYCKDEDSSLREFISISLAIGKVPVLTFVNIDDYLARENKNPSRIAPGGK